MDKPIDMFRSESGDGLIMRGFLAKKTERRKISQHFENHLDRERWHSQLLRKMGVNIPGVRPDFLSEPAIASFRELMVFRHFTRHYFELEYDWQKLDFLAVKLETAHENLIKHAALFRKLLIE